MKAKFTYLLVLSVLFLACSERDLYDETRVPEEVGNLVVPADFDWSMTADVSCAFTATTATPVKVYTDASRKDNSLVAEYTLMPDQEALTLTVPSYASKLYLVVGGVNEEVEVVNGVANYVAVATRGSKDGDQLPGEVEITGKIFFPAKDPKMMATVMFEDNFPVKGDYDFNDFVINYRYVAELDSKQGSGDISKMHINSLDFEIKVRALGGIYKYTPYLCITKANGQLKEGSADGVKLVGENSAIVEIVKYTQRPSGALFLNTDPNESSVGNADLETAKFRMEFNGGLTQQHTKMDFFLKGVGHEGEEYEIHQRGFEPAFKDYSYPKKNSLLGGVNYITHDNLVWGFTVPANIPHAIEKGNFLDAYPRFKNWAESGGKDDEDWYEHPVSKYLFPMN